MSADAGVDPAAPNLNLSPEEKRVYGQLFRQADTDNAGVVTGEVAVKFFEKTRLDSRVLGEIWQIADKENRGFLTPAGFGIVLRLIGHAQAGREPSPTIAVQQGPIPRFDGIFVSPAPAIGPSSPTAAPIQAQGTGGAIRIPPLTPDKVAQYSSLFERQPLQGSLLPGEQARQIFDKSGLPNEALGKIWELSDTEQRGALVQTEFIIAMHLLTSLRTGTLAALPNILPAALYEAATQRGAGAAGAAQRQSPINTGMSAIPRQLSGQAQPRTGSPLGRPPLTPQDITGANDWAVTPADKARFDQIYNGLDKTNKGYITGEEAVPFFGESRLPEDALAQIWDLADFNSHGQLTREGFAVAMYLIRQQRSGRTTALPATLPANLIPPSLRTQARPAPAASAFAPPPVTQPVPPQPKSALEDLFGLDSGTTSPVPAPIQTTMSTGGSTANDPFSGGNNILPPSSPVRASPTVNTFKPFIPSSSFGRGLSTQVTGDSSGTPSRPQQTLSASDDLLGDNDESKNISGETTELANISSQISTLSKQTQDTQAKRSANQNELNQTNSQKANFEQRLAQLRTLYEKEARDTRALEEQLKTARNDTKKLQGECMTLEGTYQDAQAQHKQVLASLQADQQENTNLRERIRVVNGEIAQLKPQIEKLKSEARQQKGLVAINKKQLSTIEGERDKLKTEAEDLTKSNEELSRQIESISSVSPPAQVASPALSTASGNNPFFKRTASTDIMGVLASPPAKTYSTDKSFDEVFGPSVPASSTSTPPPAPAFQPQTTGASVGSAGSYSSPTGSPVMSRQQTLTADPPAVPESRQISSSFLPFPEHDESLSSSRQVSPPASRAEGSGIDATNPFPGNDPVVERVDSIPGAFPTQDMDAKNTPTETPVPAATPATGPSEAETKVSEPEESTAAAPDPFGGDEQAKAKADFDNAFAAFTTSKNKAPETGPAAPHNGNGFDSEFPPISELERDEESDSNSEGGFEDDFAPTSPERKFGEAKPSVPEPIAAEPTPPAVPEKETKPAEKSEQPSSPATITNASPQQTSVDDIFGSAATGTIPSTSQALPSNPPAPPPKGAFDDLDDDFEGLEDAKEGSADDDFANISRSGLDDFNPVFDSSPPASQTKSDSTAFGNESSFDFVSSNSASGGPAPASGNQQKGADSHDWDAIFAGLDAPPAVAPPPALETPVPPPVPATEGEGLLKPRPVGPGRALTTEGVHDDPILKNLTGMGYTRTDALTALEKYDYNLERAANYLASQS